MAGHNRHLKGDQGTIIVPVKGNVAVETGDLMFRAGAAGMVGQTGTADNYAYPISSLANAGTALSGLVVALNSNFIGVAMEGSASGVTENITVATKGVFKFPQIQVSAVTVGALVSAVSPSTISSGLTDQTVAIYGDAYATTAYLGYVTKTESGASFVDFQIRTIFTGVAS